MPGDQIAEAVGGAQHLGHDHADDHERAPSRSAATMDGRLAGSEM